MDRHLLLAALLALFLFPGQTAAASKTTALRQPQPAGSTIKATPAKRDAPRPAEQTAKAGATLFDPWGCTTLANECLFDPLVALGFNASGPNGAERIFALPDPQGGLARFASPLPVGTVAPAAASSFSGGSGIAIQPLDVDAKPFTPLFGDPFTPHAGMRPLPGGAGLAAIGMEPAFAADLLQASTRQAGSPGRSDAHAGGKAPLAYRYSMDRKTKTSINAGVTWIQNLDDATGMRPSSENSGDDGSAANNLPGVSLNLGVGYKAVTLTGGYIRGLDNHTSTDLVLAGVERNPAAWNSELAYATELLNREATLAVGYQRSSETIHTYLPDERYRTRASIALTDSTFFSLEYYLDKNDSTKNGGADGYGIATKIGFGF